MKLLGRVLLLAVVVAGALVAMSLAWDHHAVMPEEEARARHMQEGREHAPRSVERTGTVPDVLGESSGVAASRARPGVLWTHNDAGGMARLFALSPAGSLLGVFRLENVQARDWEDVDLGPCPPVLDASASSCLYVADTGDNERRRSSYQVLVVPEPDPERSGGAEAVVVPARSLNLELPGGSADVEALAVEPDGGLILLSKGRSGSIRIFRIAAPDVVRGLRDGASILAADAGTLAIEPHGVVGRMVTGAAISPSGRTMVVRTYTELYFYRLEPGGRPVRVGDPCFLGDLEPQGEAVDFLDEETVVITSESAWGREGGIHRVRCR